ncbi:hypothetical protein [Sediminicoccus rosea]|uniref:Acyltransferase n=1 Tax=Sediminicoccus rosea TaxID=1225128 RepID=A0ABZ0PD05_9PROT|nr:hypothetical protein [Sediminicoccus rosea]WPB83583.1 hypothetical protein R9Z33_15895 [Sediminicoccus rosea]
MLEPLGAYESVVTMGPAHVHCALKATPPKSVKGTGADNFIFGGSYSISRSLSIIIEGDRNVIILGAYSRLGALTIKIVGSGGVVFIGAFCTASSGSIVMVGENSRIIMGEDCMLSSRIVISNTDSHSIFDVATGARINRERDVVIGNHVWIGRDARIGKGAQVGHDCVIAQSAIVSGEIAPFSVAGGVPARPLREGATWSRVRAATIAEAEASPQMVQQRKSVAALQRRIAAYAEARSAPACDALSPEEFVPLPDASAAD